MTKPGTCAILDEFPDYAEVIEDVLRSRGVAIAQLLSMPPEAARAHIVSACDAVLAHELQEDGCSSRALDLADRLNTLEQG